MLNVYTVMLPKDKQALCVVSSEANIYITLLLSVTLYLKDIFFEGHYDLALQFGCSCHCEAESSKHCIVHLLIGNVSWV